MVNAIENRISEATSDQRFAQKARDLTRQSYVRLRALTMTGKDSTRQTSEDWQELRTLRNRIPASREEFGCGEETLSERLAKTLNKNGQSENGSRDRWNPSGYLSPVRSELYHLGLVELDDNS